MRMSIVVAASLFFIGVWGSTLSSADSPGYGCAAEGESDNVRCERVRNAKPQKRRRHWATERGCTAFGERPGAVRAVNMPFVFYGSRSCPSSVGPLNRSPFEVKRSMTYRQLYSGSVYEWSGPSGSTTDWLCWDEAAAPPAGAVAKLGDCAVCY